MTTLEDQVEVVLGTFGESLGQQQIGLAQHRLDPVVGDLAFNGVGTVDDDLYFGRFGVERGQRPDLVSEVFGHDHRRGGLTALDHLLRIGSAVGLNAFDPAAELVADLASVDFLAAESK